ncbi:SGNH/GDSL hydrolase family protein [Archangium violaceum]|uniref:SGNH/GDSL hydrolase family protein n=1 Tax=Archangium violaceum TaxID=83451 RepID=UPI00193C4A00|nr:SGNH/GDSL hydrolase family protein [Archangium violaceum]QRK12157.1 SGNH/GDSL hydrolase family protein [Archangium violaceum]
MLTVFTFGDSVLDCGHYNRYGVSPGELLVHNWDDLFPEFLGQDLSALGGGRLEQLAQDGGTVNSLARQLRGVESHGPSVALVSVGGNDLLQGLLLDAGPGFEEFRRKLSAFLTALPIRPVLIANVYDPTVGDDRHNFTGVPVERARDNHRRMNDLIAELASEHGVLVDLHKHFLEGDASWFTSTIEPSLRGASEVRRCFWRELVKLRPAGVAAAP